MRYYIIAGEASGDLHASRLIRELRLRDAQAEFRGIGGDLMKAEGARLVRHYRHLAYMGLFPVLMHLPAILRTMRDCQSDIVNWQPHALILVDYPGFNLEMARYTRARTSILVFYYIAPKLWAWKEYRIRRIRRDVDRVFSILPFEVPFFQDKHHCPVSYVGNPTVDEVSTYLALHPADPAALRADFGLSSLPVVALLPGSRRQEIRDNLPIMVRAALPLCPSYQLVVAGAPGVGAELYDKCVAGAPVRVVYGQTYRLLQHSVAAMVVSGTATLETALLRVPQVVCYAMRAGRLANLGRRLFIKTSFISLVNLVAGSEVVPELVAAQMTVVALRRHLLSILPGGERREPMLRGYRLMTSRLGEPGAPARAAQEMTELLANGQQP